MRNHTVDLVYFAGCPNVERARQNIRAAVGAAQGADAWNEWNLSDDATPDRFRRFGSPTVLVDGEDVTASGEGNAAVACRADGAPRAAVICEALSR